MSNTTLKVIRQIKKHNFNLDLNLNIQSNSSFEWREFTIELETLRNITKNESIKAILQDLQDIVEKEMI